MSHIFQAESKVPDLTQNIPDYDVALSSYPYPIAQAIEKFLALSKENEESMRNEKSREVLKSLMNLFEQLVFFLAAVILSNYRYLSLAKDLEFEYPNIDMTLNKMFEALNSIHALKVPTIIPNLLETLFLHKDNLYKISGWKTTIDNEELDSDTVESYMITSQYLIEGFLMDIEYLKNFGFYRIIEPGHRQLSLNGLRNHHRIREIILPTQANAATHDELLKKTDDLVGNCVFYNPVKKIFLDLSPYIEINIVTSGSNAQEYRLSYRRNDGDAPSEKKAETKEANLNVK